MKGPLPHRVLYRMLKSTKTKPQNNKRFYFRKEYVSTTFNVFHVIHLDLDYFIGAFTAVFSKLYLKPSLYISFAFILFLYSVSFRQFYDIYIYTISKGRTFWRNSLHSFLQYLKCFMLLERSMQTMQSYNIANYNNSEFLFCFILLN